MNTRTDAKHFAEQVGFGRFQYMDAELDSLRSRIAQAKKNLLRARINLVDSSFLDYDHKIQYAKRNEQLRDLKIEEANKQFERNKL